jgi:hypothetical protein
MKSIPRKTNFHAEEKCKVNTVRDSRMEIERESKVTYNFHAFHLNLPLYKSGVGDSSSASENPIQPSFTLMRDCPKRFAIDDLFLTPPARQATCFHRAVIHYHGYANEMGRRKLSERNNAPRQ